MVGAVERLADGRLTVVGCLLGRQPPAGNAADGTWPVPWLAMPEGATRALANAWWAQQARRRPPDPAVRPPEIDAGAARRVLAGAEPDAWLSPEDLATLLGRLWDRLGPADRRGRSGRGRRRPG